jgi:nitric oxide reductase subunit B
MQQQLLTSSPTRKVSYATDKAALAFIVLAMSYLLLGLLFGSIGGLQYVLPPFLKKQLSFQKTRPLHVYLVIAWIFTAAQGCIYYFVPRIAKRKFAYQKAVWLHWCMQLIISTAVVVAFFTGHFGGREYLEFPPWMGACIILSWIPFAVNFFVTLKPSYQKAPVYIWSWSAGILFFFITLSESYLWLIDYFNNNIVRDVTVQWKALGSMVGSWNMLVYGCAMFVMSRLNGDNNTMRKPVPFFFFFLGLTNLMFNWGHHTYIVPAAPWVKMVAYIISMTELLILGHIIFKWRKTLSHAQKHFHRLPYRMLSFADAWIFLNLSLAIVMSVPAINYFTHGTHITVAHAMGATIGINTMILFGAIFYIVQQEKAIAFERFRKLTSRGIAVTNISLIFFWTSLIGSGMVKASGQMQNKAFAVIMQSCQPLFKLFATSGVFIMIGLGMMIVAMLLALAKKEKAMITVQDEMVQAVEV